MTISLRVVQLPEPQLEFGSGATREDPKHGLTAAGPFSLRYRGGQPFVRLGIVGPDDAVAEAVTWFERCRSTLLSENKNRQRHPDWPGFERVFRTPLEMDDRWLRALPSVGLERALLAPQPERFREILDLYGAGVESLAERELGPNVIVCAFSDRVLDQAATLSEKPTHRPRRTPDPNQLALSFDFTADAPGESPTYRTLRRALKARVMRLKHHQPTQLVTSHLFRDGPNRDDAAARAWSVGVGIYYKARGIPWRLAHVAAHVCFVGISFHRYTSTARDVTYASLAQAFSTDIEGFVLRGEAAPRREDRQVHLDADQAVRLGRRILKEYIDRAGRAPVRVTLHKTTRFSFEETAGFRDALRDVPTVELVTLSPSNYRLITGGEYPPFRGTFCTINDQTRLLYTTGVYRPWGTYPGPHIPAPLEIVAPGIESDALRRVSEETLGLTKMSWNSASIGGRDPITLRMAYEVGPIMAELPEDAEPEPSYRYYM